VLTAAQKSYRSADASQVGELRLSNRRINQGRTDALRQGTMRPWKPSPNPAFDLSAGSPRAQASRGFYSFLYGDSVESRRARPFAASGAPCLTLNLTGARPSSTTTSRPNRSASTRGSPASHRLGLLSRSVWLGKPESNPVTAARPGCASSTGQGGTGFPVPYRIVSRAIHDTPHWGGVNRARNSVMPTRCKTPGGRSAPKEMGTARALLTFPRPFP
jgi:hypothetical protein